MPPQVTHYLTAILEDCLIRCIHFLQSAAAASNGTSCPGIDSASPIVELLVLCTVESLCLVRACGARKSSITMHLSDRRGSSGRSHSEEIRCYTDWVQLGGSDFFGKRIFY